MTVLPSSNICYDKPLAMENPAPHRPPGNLTMTIFFWGINIHWPTSNWSSSSMVTWLEAIWSAWFHRSTMFVDVFFLKKVLYFWGLSWLVLFDYRRVNPVNMVPHGFDNHVHPIFWWPYNIWYHNCGCLMLSVSNLETILQPHEIVNFTSYRKTLPIQGTIFWWYLEGLES